MDIKRIYRTTTARSPQWQCLTYAFENGFRLQREPFGKRGSCIEVFIGDEKLGYRKSYSAALKLMQKHKGGL